MESFEIIGGTPLYGATEISGAKNVALKACVAALLTDEPIVLRNIPLISDVAYMLAVLKDLGVNVDRNSQTIRIKNSRLKKIKVDLEVGARLRTSSLVIGPLLARYGEAIIPNPGGCRIGTRPIDRHIDGLRAMGADISYNSSDGYFYAKASNLHGTHIRFTKNTHTGTEAIILAAVLAEGRTIIENAAEEVEIDNLIELLCSMGARIIRSSKRLIIIDGAKYLRGTEFNIMPDRNEEVTFAIAAALTGGEITINNSQRQFLSSFLKLFKNIGGSYKIIDEHTTKYSRNKILIASDVNTGPYPAFMTDWQAPWSVLMTQATGTSVIHETVFESRFAYVYELLKMGAKIEFFDPKVRNPNKFYNFNWDDGMLSNQQSIKIYGPTKLHNAILEITDLRAGATLVLAALVASGESYVYGVEQIDRGYENLEVKLKKLGANIKRVGD